MSLSDRIDKISDKLSPKELKCFHVIVVYPHQTKAEAYKEYQLKNDYKEDEPIYWIKILPSWATYQHKEFMDKNKKVIKDLIDNKDYSLNRIFDEYLEKGF